MGEPARSRRPVHVVGLLGGRPVGRRRRGRPGRRPRSSPAARDQLAAVADLLGARGRDRDRAAPASRARRRRRPPGPGRACWPRATRASTASAGRSAARLGAERLRVHPAPSSVALAFARLGLAWDDAVVRSCHTGDAARAAAEVAAAARGRRALRAGSPARGGGRRAARPRRPPPRWWPWPPAWASPARRSTRCADLAALAAGRFDHRSVVVLRPPGAVGVAARRRAPAAARSPTFAHRAWMITKPEVRARRARPPRPARPRRAVGRRRGQRQRRPSRRRWPRPACGSWPSSADPTTPSASWPTPPRSARWSRWSTGAAPAVLAGLPRTRPGVRRRRRARRARRLPGRRCAPGGRLVATFAAADRAAGRPRPARLAGAGAGRPGRDAARRRGALRGRQPGVRRLGRPARPSRGPGADVPTAVVVVGVGCSYGGDRRRGAPPWSTSPGARRPAAGPTGRRDRHRSTGGPATRPSSPPPRRPPLVPSRPRCSATVDVPNPSAGGGRRGGHAQRGRGGRAPGRRARGPARGHQAACVPPPPPRSPSGAAGRAGPDGCTVVGPRPGRRRAPHARPRSPPSAAADAVVGYGPYVDAVADLLRPDQRVVRSAMGAEAERAERGRRAGRRPAGGWRWCPRAIPACSPWPRSPWRARGRPARRRAGRGRPRRDRRPRRRRAAAGAPLAGPHAVAHPVRPAGPLGDDRGPAAGRGRRGAGAGALQPPLRRAGPTTWTGPGGPARACSRPTTPVVVATDAGGPDRAGGRAPRSATLDPTEAACARSCWSARPTPRSSAGAVVTRRHHPRPRPDPPPRRRRCRRCRTVIPPVHPIEAESYRILAERVDLGRWPPLVPGGGGPGRSTPPPTSATPTRSSSTRPPAPPASRRCGRARRSSSDVEMVAVASPPGRRPVRCSPRAAPGPPTRPGRRARPHRRRPPPCGSPPSAGRRAPSWSSATPRPRWPRCSRLAAAGPLRAGAGHRPAGRLRRRRRGQGRAARRAGCRPISNVGERGGSAVAAAALNALWRLSQEDAGA